MRLLYFTQDNCHACSIQESQLEKYTGSIPIEKYHFNTHGSLFTEYGVNQTPVLILLDGNIEMKRRVGVLYNDQLEDWLQ